MVVALTLRSASESFQGAQIALLHGAQLTHRARISEFSLEDRGQAVATTVAERRGDDALSGSKVRRLVRHVHHRTPQQGDLEAISGHRLFAGVAEHGMHEASPVRIIGTDEAAPQGTLNASRTS
ncbi:MAG: hypothetical protein DWG82_01840 [Chloroflexi bacterium]|nr:hypothetical protein [Chloroflexota bacterium]